VELHRIQDHDPDNDEKKKSVDLLESIKKNALCFEQTGYIVCTCIVFPSFRQINIFLGVKYILYIKIAHRTISVCRNLMLQNLIWAIEIESLLFLIQT